MKQLLFTKGPQGPIGATLGTAMNNFYSSPNKVSTHYGTAKKKRPGYLVGNLVATNWPIEKALHAIGYNQIPTK